MLKAKYLFLPAIIGIVFLNLCAKSQNLELIKDVQVGIQPLSVIYLPQSASFAVFCNGADNNYDGIYEDGESRASLWTVNAGSLSDPQKISDYNNYFKFPLRIGLDSSTGKLAVPFSTEVSGLNTELAISDSNLTGSAALGAYYLDSEKLVLMTQPDDFSKNGSISLWNLSDSSKLNEFDAYPSPIDIVAYSEEVSGNSEKRLAILSEGLFGSPTSILQIVSVSGNTFTVLDTLQLGDTGNKTALAYPYLYVVMNGSHTIQKVDLNQKKIVNTIPTGTEGFGGPREIAILGKYAYVTTYSSDLRVLDLGTDEFTGKYDLPGNAEGLSIGPDNTLAVTIPGAYNNTKNIIRFYKIITSGVTENSNSENNFLLYPIPAKESVTISNRTSDHAECGIYNGCGNLINNFGLSSNSEKNLNLETLHLSNGVYYILIRFGSRTKVLSFVVQN